MLPWYINAETTTGSSQEINEGHFLYFQENYIEVEVKHQLHMDLNSKLNILTLYPITLTLNIFFGNYTLIIEHIYESMLNCSCMRISIISEKFNSWSFFGEAMAIQSSRTSCQHSRNYSKA